MKRDAQQEGLRWLEQAEADRYGAQLLFDGASYHLACFVAQQIAEKALKAFIYTHYPNGLPDSIPARVYTQAAAEEALRLADRTLRMVQTKLRTQSLSNGD